MEKKNGRFNVLSYCENLFLVLYFLLLFGERLTSVIYGFVDPAYIFWRTDDFVQWYAHILTVVSLSAALILFCTLLRPFIRSLFSPISCNKDGLNYSSAAITAGVLLVGGMTHTNFTLLGLQFAAYAALLLSMLMRTIRVQEWKRAGITKGRLYISYLYLLCFSMAIPVVYSVSVPAAAFYIPLEIVTSLLLVAAFTYMLARFYAGGGLTNFGIPLLLYTVAADVTLIVLRWTEFANIFMLVFLILTVVFWLLGRSLYGNAQIVYFEGANKRRGYFEGWYFKLQNDRDVLAFIPSYHVTGDGRKYSMLQVVSSGEPLFFHFAADEFGADTDKLNVTVGHSRFDEKGIELDLEANGHRITGKVSFGALTPLKKDIMGFFAAFPLMQCKHGVISMRHGLTGRIDVDGKLYDFDGGTGYIEKDKGNSFPSDYLWTQGCGEGTSVMVSVAKIPYAGLRFTGCICSICHNGKEYRLATYNGAKAVRTDDSGVTVKRGRYRLEVSAMEKNHCALAAPDNGEMSRVIHESPSVKVRYKFTDRNQTVFDITCSAGFETGKAD